ncbi:Mut7-C RNAse domain-containing protein, partial [Dehalococcoidia bacterium]|nr:Mut7-C RNAse domain-containing protein [Dehalococcoidia bacterium]
NVREQLRQVVETLYLESGSDPFSLCLECNEPLIPRGKEEVRDLVPPYVLQTQEQYVQCPGCNRIYWRGTHWQRMREELEQLLKPGDPFHNGETLASGGIP